MARGRRQMIVKLAQPSNMLESCHAQERVTIRLSSCSGELVQILLRHFQYPTASRRLLYPAARLEFIGNYASSDQDLRRTPVT